MTAGEILAALDEMRPNPWDAERKLAWLRRLDGQIVQELQRSHTGAVNVLPEVYTTDTPLLAPFPYGEELYLAYLLCQNDLYNGEISKYNQSMQLLAGAWRQFADWVNRLHRPLGAADWEM